MLIKAKRTGRKLQQTLNTFSPNKPKMRATWLASTKSPCHSTVARRHQVSLNSLLVPLYQVISTLQPRLPKVKAGKPQHQLLPEGRSPLHPWNDEGFKVEEAKPVKLRGHLWPGGNFKFYLFYREGNTQL